MTFAHPLALLWGLAAIPLFLLYLRRTVVRRVPVATGMIWEQALAAEHARAAWRRWRQPASLALQLAVLALLVLALAEPQLPAPPPGPFLAAAAAALLLLQWYLYQQRWVD